MCSIEDVAHYRSECLTRKVAVMAVGIDNDETVLSSSTSVLRMSINLGWNNHFKIDKGRRSL